MARPEHYKDPEKREELEKFEAAYRQLIGQAIISGLITPRVGLFPGFDSFVASAKGDYDQNSGDYTQTTCGSHQQNSGNYTQSC